MNKYIKPETAVYIFKIESSILGGSPKSTVESGANNNTNSWLNPEYTKRRNEFSSPLWGDKQSSQPNP